MKVVTYSRVSTAKQDVELQNKELKKFCDFKNLKVIRHFEDVGSGSNNDRPGFKELMKLIQSPIHIDALVIYKLDRIGRSIKNLIDIAHVVQDNNVELIAISNNIDTTTKEGRLFFYIMSAIAEFERELIIERTQLGIAEAKANGKICHRPKIPIDMKKVFDDITAGVPKSKICKKLGISRVTLYNRLKEVVDADYTNRSDSIDQQTETPGD